MGKLEKEKTTLPCPNCKRDIEVTYYDMYSRREAKCRRCGSFYKFGSSEASNLRSRIQDVERSQEKFAEAIMKIMEKAEITIKR